MNTINLNKITNTLTSKFCESSVSVWKLNGCIKFLLAILVFLFLQNCAPISIKPPSVPFSHQNIADIISNFKDQERRAQNFISSGRLISKKDVSESESNILIVGTKDPFKIKIETTHPWGRPLLHFLIYETRIQILSFPEKKYYLGNFCTTKIFPVRLTPNQVWALLRGYPTLKKHNRAFSFKGNQITLFDKKDDIVQVIDFYPQSKLPRQIFFPEQKIRIVFSNYKNENGICYASNIRLSDPEVGIELTLELKQMVFNKIVPTTIFDLKIPPNFRLFTLQEVKED